MRVALKVEVSTLRGAREGIPNLLRLFGEYKIQASFFFPMGVDLSGKELLASWRRRHELGYRALLFGTLLKAPKLSELVRQSMLAAREDGHDVGLSALDPFTWRTNVAGAGQEWLRTQLDEAFARYGDIMGEMPRMFASQDWRISPHLLSEEERTGLIFASDVRGKYPFLPQLQGVSTQCPQIPTTLPTLSETLRRRPVKPDNVHEYLYADSCQLLPAGHVYTLRAEHEGLDYLEVMEKLIVMWKGQEGALRNLSTIHRELNPDTLPRHQIGWGAVPGRRDHVAMQSVQVPR